MIVYIKKRSNETKNRKNRILNNVNQVYNKYSDTYDSENLNERDENFFDPSQFKILGKKKQNRADWRKKWEKVDWENTERDAKTSMAWYKQKRVWRIIIRDLQ